MQAPEQKINVLLVDDRADGLLAMEATLARPEYNLIKASSGEEALRYFLRDDFAVVLLDVQMPKMNGFETARRMHASQSQRKTPIIFVTAISTDERWVYAGYESGAVDYIFKPYDAIVLTSKVAVFANMHRMQNEIESQAIRLQKAELKNLEQQLSQMELENLQRNQSVIDAVPHLVWHIRLNHLVDYVNKKWLDNTGLTIKESLGDGWKSGVCSEDLDKLVAVMSTGLNAQKPFDTEARIKRADGVFRWYFISFSPEFSLNGEVAGWVGTGTDIHDRKLIEEERREIFKLEKSARLKAEGAIAKGREAEVALIKAKQAAEDANHAKSRLLANMSHEIRTPLGIILGFSELLLASTMDDSEQQRCIHTIINNGRQLAKLIDDILDISKIEAGRLEIENIPFDLPTVLSELAETLDFNAKEKGMAIEIDCDANVPSTVVSDPTRVRQILTNIMGNAIKFTENGTLRVGIKADSDQPDSLGRVRIVFTIQDTGIGISSEQQMRLFQDFMQADSSTTRRFGGTGLGLALSKRLAKSLGGDLVLDHSSLGEGSVFKFWIMTKASQAEKVTFDQSDDNHDGDFITDLTHQTRLLDGIKILLVDDAPDNQNLVKMMLNHVGAEVDLASDGAEGVERALGTEYDIILMDLQMPKLDGYQATRLLRKEGYKKPIIALTAHAMKDERERCLQIGFDAHHCKPINFKKIFTTIKSFVSSSQPSEVAPSKNSFGGNFENDRNIGV